MTTPQQTLNFAFSAAWNIRRPALYRYLEKKWVDQFFTDGSLRLSSFTQFSKHTDEQRQDTREGFGIVSNVSPEGYFSSTVMSQGQNAYVLCTSTLYSPTISNDFKTDSGFRINNIFEFCNAISSYIPGFKEGIEGPCHYVNSKVIKRNMEFDLEAMGIPGTNNIDATKLAEAQFRMAGNDLLFTKLEKYSHQNEYRMLWFMPRNAEQFIDVKCPEAIQFCTKFEDI